MNRLSASLLVAGFAFSGTAAAQSSGYYGQEDGYYRNDASVSDATYDYARVLRVDPVIGSGYGSDSVYGDTSRQCRETRSDEVYVGSQRYGRDEYGRDDGHYGQGDGYYDRDGDYRDRRADENSRTVATVIGGIAGAVLGSKVGDGSGRYVGTAVGSMVGGMAGRSIYDSSVRNRQYERRGTVRVCDPEPVSRRDDYEGDRYPGYDRDERLAGYDVTYEYANRTYRTRTNYHPGDRIRVRVDVQAE